ncbi:unnamed protein product [Lathyrus oleraceus]
MQVHAVQDSARLEQVIPFKLQLLQQEAIGLYLTKMPRKQAHVLMATPWIPVGVLRLNEQAYCFVTKYKI